LLAKKQRGFDAFKEERAFVPSDSPRRFLVWVEGPDKLVVAQEVLQSIKPARAPLRSPWGEGKRKGLAYFRGTSSELVHTVRGKWGLHYLVELGNSTTDRIPDCRETYDKIFLKIRKLHDLRSGLSEKNQEPSSPSGGTEPRAYERPKPRRRLREKENHLWSANFKQRISLAT